MVLFAPAFSTLLRLQLSASATSKEILRWEEREKQINKERKRPKKIQAAASSQRGRILLYIPGCWVIIGRVENQPWWHSVEPHHKSDKTIHVTQFHCLIHRVFAPDTVFFYDVVLRPVVPAMGPASLHEAHTSDAV